ncbi:MAG: glycosyltransferase family 2 protein [Candidatus Binatia bacterium]
MNSPDLSIVIVSYNVREYLRECLNSVPAACGGLSVEVFVTDNASRDESAALVEREFPGVHLSVNSENLGMARAVNQVLPQVRGRYTLLLNPDTVMPKDALARLVAVTDRWPEVGVAGPLIRDPADGGPLETFCSLPTWRDAFLLYTIARPFLRRPSAPAWQPTFDHPSASGQLIGACFLIRRELLKELGGLDQGYFLFYEDTEYCRRALEAGWKILHTREAEVFHHQGKSTIQEMPDWIWGLHLKGLFRYLQTDKAAGTWFYGAVFKALFFCKILLQSFESMVKIPSYSLTKRVDAAARHRRRLKRNAWLMGELLRRRLFA